MSWMIATALAGCSVTGYLFFRYTWCLSLGLPAKIVVFALFMLLGCLPLLVGYNHEKALGGFYSFYRYALYFVFIFCVILFTITLLSDAVFGILCYATPWLRHMTYIGCWWFKYGNIVLALLFSVYALYAGTKVPGTKEVVLSSDKISAPQKIVLLSDIHVHRVISPDKVRGIVEKTNALEPDVILLAGDIIDDNVARVHDISLLLKGLRAKNGIYFVTGNHEFYAGYRETVAELKKLGFTFLENNGAALPGNIYLGGIADVRTAERLGIRVDLEKTFAEAQPGQYRILMSHTPANFEQKNNFDLEVSGHTHGGQIFPFHILAKWYNRYLAGQYNMTNNAKIYVSRGAGQWGPQMRFLAPSEITLINLLPETKEK